VSGSPSFGWLDWALLPLGVPSASFGCELLEKGCMVNLHRLMNNMEMNKNKGMERLMIVNVPELQWTAQREVVVGDVGTAALEFLTVVPFVIHVVMQ
jgi:hypothetical protein